VQQFLAFQQQQAMPYSSAYPITGFLAGGMELEETSASCGAATTSGAVKYRSVSGKPMIAWSLRKVLF